MRNLWWWGVPLGVAAVIAAFLYADEPLGDHSDLAYSPRPEQGWTRAQLNLRVNWEASDPPEDLVEQVSTRADEAKAWVTQHDAKRRGILEELQTTPEVPWISPEKGDVVRYHYPLLKLQVLHVATLEPGEVREAELTTLCRCVKNITAVPEFIRFIFRWHFNVWIRELLAQDAISAKSLAELNHLIDCCDTTAPVPSLFEETLRL